MKQIRYPNPDVTTTVTTTKNAIPYNSTVIQVSSTTGFAIDDFVLLESQGHEKNEIVKITNIENGVSITVSSTTLPHDAGIIVTKLLYDQYIIAMNTDGGTSWTPVVTANLDYSNPRNCIEYLDGSANASDSLYYQISYYNSATHTTNIQATVHNEDNFSYCTAADFRTESKIDSTQLPDSLIYDALVSGVEYIKDKLYRIQVLESAATDTVWNVDIGKLEFADYNGDRVIDKNDFIIFEYDNTTNFRTYLSHKILKIYTDKPKILFKENVPSAGKTLVFHLPVTYKKFNDIRSSLKIVNKLLAINYVLTNTKNSTLRDAILSWTAGGTTIQKDPNAVQIMIEANKKQADTLINEILLRMATARTKMRTEWSSLNYNTMGRGFNFYTEYPSMKRR